MESWYVDADARGRRIGASLMNAAERWARDRGYRAIASDTEIDNVASQRAHAALGFREVERTVHLKKDL